VRILYLFIFPIPDAVCFVGVDLCVHRRKRRSLFVVQKHWPDFYYAYLLTAFNLIRLETYSLLWDGKKFGLLDRRSSARPGLGLDIIHFNLEGFYVWMQTS
jgi:hypothetical protein